MKKLRLTPSEQQKHDLSALAKRAKIMMFYFLSGKLVLGERSAVGSAQINALILTGKRTRAPENSECGTKEIESYKNKNIMFSFVHLTSVGNWVLIDEFRRNRVLLK